jgi:hypothetical protein
VSEQLLNDLGMDSPAKEQRGAGVPEVVEAYLGQSGPIKERFEGALDEVLGVEGRADPRGEDQAVIFVETSESHLLF